MRGLNSSFLKTLQSQLEKDALIDLSRFFAEYVNYWNQLAGNSSVEMKKAAGTPSEPALKPSMKEEHRPASLAAAITLPATENLTSLQPAESAPVVKPSFSFPLPSATTKVAPPISSQSTPSFNFSLPTVKTEASAPIADQPAAPFTFSLPKPSEGAFNFSFNAPSTTFGMLSPGATQSQAKESTTEVGGAEEAEDEPLEPPTIAVIRTGAGEEDEECMAEARVKLFTFGEEKSWVDLGVAIFKVNKRKEAGTGPNRILCRGEASGLLLLNSAITKEGTSVDWPGKKDVKITCVNQNGKLASYLVRNKEEATAKKLADAITSLLA